MTAAHHDDEGDVLAGVVEAGRQAGEPDVVHEEGKDGREGHEGRRIQALEVEARMLLPGGLRPEAGGELEDRARGC